MAKSRRAPEEPVRRRRPDDDDAAPRRRTRAVAEDEDDDAAEDDGPIKPRRKKKSAAGPVKKVLRIVGAVLGSILLIVFLYWVYSPIGVDSSMLCYFPKETTFLQGYDFEEVMKNTKMNEVHTVLVNNYKTFGDERWGGQGDVKETDVVKYLHGRASGDSEEDRTLEPQQRRGALTVLRFRKPVDEAKFVAGISGKYQVEPQDGKDGRKFYHLWWKKKVPPDWHEEREDDVSFFFPNTKTLVYATTRRELFEAMTRSPGKVVLEGNMRELADKVDGLYFQASAGWYEMNGVSNSMAMGLGFTGDEFKDPQRRMAGIVGTASWFASNGNDFLYASANLYGDLRTAREIRDKLQAAYKKAQADIYQSESGKPGGLTDPFNPPEPKAAGGPRAGGMMTPPGGGTSGEQSADILPAVAEFAKSARVYNRGRLVVVEGLIPHGTPEQGIFEKFWQAVSQKFTGQRPGGSGPGGFGPGGVGPPGMGPGGPTPPGR